MSDKNLNLKNLFNDFINSLFKGVDGKFHSNKYPEEYHKKFGISGWGNGRLDGILNVPSIEDICDYFEKEIVSKIPQAILLIQDNLSINILLGEKYAYLQTLSRAHKELDIYESLKTLFFPTMREELIKFGKLPPEWIFFASKRDKVTHLSENGAPYKIENMIRVDGPNHYVTRYIDNTAIDFLNEDIEYYLKNFKFHNPIPITTITLPQPDITVEELESRPRRRKKGYLNSELYSYEQKYEYIKKLIYDFLKYYPKLITDNFFRIRNQFYLFSKLPVKISVYTRKLIDSDFGEDIVISCFFQKKPKGEENQVEFFKNQKIEFDENIHLFMRGTSISHYLIENYLNAIPYTYEVLSDELYEVLEKIKEDSIFEDIKPFHSSVESWIKDILEAESRGGEDYSIELKSIPTESTEGDGLGNDLYGHINAFENGDGGHIYIGVDESKKGLEKIVGLEGYLRDHSKTIDQLKREIRQKCRNYLNKDIYRIESRNHKEKTII